MNIPLALQEAIEAHKNCIEGQFKQFRFWFIVLSGLSLLALYLNTGVMPWSELTRGWKFSIIILASTLILVVISWAAAFYKGKEQLNQHQSFVDKFNMSEVGSDYKDIKSAITEAEMSTASNPLIRALLDYYLPSLENRMTFLRRKDMKNTLDKESLVFTQEMCELEVNKTISKLPLLKAKDQIETSLVSLTKRREEMVKQWDDAYKNFSWFNKIKYNEGPDYSEIDSAIKELEILYQKMMLKHSNDFKKIELYAEVLVHQSNERMLDAKLKAEKFIETCSYKDQVNGSLLKKSLWLSAMAVPISLWSKALDYSDVYDALRGVNSNFSDMSDLEIWWEALLMPAESLAGLTALTKGAYFEQLVAADTGGQLHEHFNHPDTDIIIDGEAFQIKATGSEAYIRSVDESIPVISTSEVAYTTSAIDGNYTNEEITQMVDEALGGDAVDVSDTAADAVLAGLGGLGFFATLKGINHASAKYENGGDAVEAIFEGAGVAIEGTARALVGTAEMGYNIITSRPSRFVGRTLLKGLKKLDEKLSEEPIKK